jgi:hypothetical protein
VDRLSLVHPYLALFAQGIGVALSLIILVGLWFFQRWARLIFVLRLVAAVAYIAFRAPQPTSAPSFVLAMFACLWTLSGVIIAMSFLPPLRDMFANQT